MATRIVTMLLGLTLVLAVACGTAESPPEPTAAPAGPGGTAQPTAEPQPVDPPADVEVNPGKVTWMTADFGNERFDPAFSVGGLTRDYSQLLHAHLIDSDVDEGRRVIVPGIVTDWEMSSDGLTWILTVGQGFKFHDGTDITTEDALWTLQHIMGPQAQNYVLSGSAVNLSRTMERIEQTGPDQISVTSNIPVVTLPLEISEASGGAGTGPVVPKRDTLHDLEEEAAYDRNPIGAGIMRLVDHVPADSMTFERFDDYYHQPANGFDSDKRVNFTTFDLRVAPEEATRAAALRAGEVDIALVSLATREQVEAGGGRIVFGQEGVTFQIVLLGCWKSELPCYHKEVRQALQYAVDKELMRDHLYGPEIMQVKGWGRVTPSTVGYSPEMDPYPFDPHKARELLAEAGYPNGEGFGKLIVNTFVSTSLPLMPESAQLGAAMWQEHLGLDVEVRVGDKSAQDEMLGFTEDGHGQIWWRDIATRPDASEMLNEGDHWGGDRGPDQAHNDPELIALAAETNAVLDQMQREKAINDTYQRFRDEGYWMSLGYLNIPWGVGPRIQTWEPYPLAFYPSALHTITLK